MAEPVEKAIKGLPDPVLKQTAMPVDLWSPPDLGPIDIKIDRQGQWFYLGDKIEREGLVKLFSSILRCEEDGRHVLVTPAELRTIEVEDAPFVAVSVRAENPGKDQKLYIITNIGDQVLISSLHPIRFNSVDDGGTVKPYVRVRGRLDALLNRSTFYELVDLGKVQMHQGEYWYGVHSCGMFWPMAKADNIGAMDI